MTIHGATTIAAVTQAVLQGILYHAKTPTWEFTKDRLVSHLVTGLYAGIATELTSAILHSKLGCNGDALQKAFIQMVIATVGATIQEIGKAANSEEEFSSDAIKRATMGGARSSLISSVIQNLAYKLFGEVTTHGRFLVLEAAKHGLSAGVETAIQTTRLTPNHEKIALETILNATVLGALLGGIGAAAGGVLPSDAQAKKEEVEKAQGELKRMQADYDGPWHKGKVGWDTLYDQKQLVKKLADEFANLGTIPRTCTAITTNLPSTLIATDCLEERIAQAEAALESTTSVTKNAEKRLDRLRLKFLRTPKINK